MGVHDIKDKASWDSVKSNSDKVLVLDAFATWCGPCKAIAPTIAQWSNLDDYAGKVEFYKFDVDNTPELAQELGVRAMPTFKIFKNGEEVAEVIGADPRKLKSQIDSLL